MESLYNRIVFHIDVNSAFLSWEAAYRLYHLGGRLDIRKIPSAISGNKEARHGIILAKSIPAKKYGIQTGMSISDAIKKCPNLYCAPPNYGLYQKCSEAFMSILKEYSDTVEQYSIDESFVDMSGSWKLFGQSPYEVAVKLKDRINNELGFTVNIGISSNKLLAKMAGELHKPDNAETLFLNEIKDKLWPLHVSELFYVGRATTKKLLAIGISTIGELANADPHMLKLMFGKHGEVIWGFANGIDAAKIEIFVPEQKGYGNSTTIAFDVVDAETAKKVLLALSETVSRRLRADDVKAEVIAVGVKSYDLSYKSHQMVIPTSTNITTEIYHYSCRLFDELWEGVPIRHLGIHTSRIKDGTDFRQMNLFDTYDYVKLEMLDKTIDTVRTRFGLDQIKRATFVDSTIDHLSGGISREKRSVDYKKQIIE
ncbi:MAG: DNA polymerase IV [Suipraeoptans sp.]